MYLGKYGPNAGRASLFLQQEGRQSGFLRTGAYRSRFVRSITVVAKLMNQQATIRELAEFKKQIEFRPSARRGILVPNDAQVVALLTCKNVQVTVVVHVHEFDSVELNARGAADWM